MTVLAAPVLVSLALGASAAASPRPADGARARAPAKAKVAWNAITLENGWKSGQSSFTTGNPSWVVQGGVVYLSGSLRQPSGLNPLFAALPPAARPARALYMTVYTNSGSQGVLYIQPGGNMFAYGGGASRTFFSLAGVSFPAPSLVQHTLALRNGWNSSQFRWNTGDPSYAVSNGVVYLSGSLHQRASGSDVVAMLPAAARPSRNLYITVYTFKSTTGILYISSSGLIKASSGSARSFTSLAGVSFPARSMPGSALTLLNGWQSSQVNYGTGNPSVVVHNGVVYLSGSLKLPSGSNSVFAHLPPAATPSHWLYMKIYTDSGVVGSMDVQPSGDVEIFIPGASELFSSLATISYPVNS